MPDLPPPQPESGAQLTGDDITVGGDVAGRDKIVNTTTTTTTTNIEGGPAARYAIVGIVLIALAAILVIAWLAARPPVLPATPSATLTATAPPAPSATPAVVASATLEPASATPTASPPPATDTPTPPAPSVTPTPSATATEPPTFTASPTPPAVLTPGAAVPVYDAFDDRCVNAARWALQTVSSATALRNAADSATPEASATPTPEPPACLPVEDQFFTEGRDGRLTVFVGVEAAGSHGLVQAPAGCFREAEVVLAIDQADLLAPEREIFLSMGAALQRRTGPAVLEVRVRASNFSGRVETDIRPRLTVPDGTLDLSSTPYTLGQPVTVALRARDIGEAPAGGTAANKILTIYVNGQPLAPSFSIIADPCDLSIGYQAELQTSLLGFFDEVRLALD
ncbi:MAG: hypothetical protein JNK29_03605 [Anaerolineales bacterium]|nr:hypothetical protein [Anaerolineales bacterium]